MAGERRRYSVGARKIRWHQRTLVHEVLADGDRRYRGVLGADSDATTSDAERFPYGSDVAYSLELTDEEAAEFAAASNARYVEPEVEYRPHRAVGRPTGTAAVPTLATLAWMRARYVDLRRWHGRDVPVAVLDQGTTAKVRAAMGVTLLARTVTSGVTLGPGQELVDLSHGHGCLVAPNAVPAGGLLLDCVISGDSGGAGSSAIAAGITWAVDNGARVINISFGGAPNAPEVQVVVDAVTYARDRGVHIVASAGNDNTEGMSSTAALSRSFANMHSSIAFDEATDRRALFSNWAADASGCGPGVDVSSFDVHANRVRWNGTSASAPHMAQILARAMTGGTYTADQAGAAAKANTRDTGAGAEQGGGAYDLHRTLSALGAIPAAGAGVATPTHVGTLGGAAETGAWSTNPAAGVAVDDLQIAVVVSDTGARPLTPPGWTTLTDAAYLAGWEISAGQTVSPIRVHVLAAPYTAGQPNPLELYLGGGEWYSAVAFTTVRAAGGIDHERLAPTVRYGTGSAVSTVPVLPATTNDLLVCAFAQRHGSGATTATLSTPAGLTSHGFFRPGSSAVGYSLRVATVALTSASRTASFTATSSNATGTWAALALTVPSGAVPVAPVAQAEPAGPPGGAVAFLPHA